MCNTILPSGLSNDISLGDYVFKPGARSLRGRNIFGVKYSCSGKAYFVLLISANGRALNLSS